MTTFRTMLLGMAAAAGLSLCAVPAAWAAPKDRDCLSDQQIQQAIETGKIQSWPKIKRLSKIFNDYEDVSDVKVCLIDGVPFYTVNIVSPNGDAKKVLLNALDGSG